MAKGGGEEEGALSNIFRNDNGVQSCRSQSKLQLQLQGASASSLEEEEEVRKPSLVLERRFFSSSWRQIAKDNNQIKRADGNSFCFGLLLC